MHLLYFDYYNFDFSMKKMSKMFNTSLINQNINITTTHEIAQIFSPDVKFAIL